MVFSKLAIKSLYIAISSYCKENSLVFWQKIGRPPQLPLAAVLTVFIQFTLSRRRDFKAFYCGCDGELLLEIFPKMASCSALLHRLAPSGEILTKFLQTTTETGFYIVDSTSFKRCENVCFYNCRLFPEFAKRACFSTRCAFSFKPYFVIDERGKIVAFRLTDGSRHDVKEAENLLRGCIGTAIGDEDYGSSQVRERLERTGLRFITPARTKIEQREHGRGKRPLSEEKFSGTRHRKIKATCRRQFFTLSRPGNVSGDYCDRHTDVKSRSSSFAARIAMEIWPNPWELAILEWTCGFPSWTTLNLLKLCESQNFEL